jgi:Protein of unknown function (DUF1592)/Protein of unknown function (DUF1588)/Protein of unknown function (DUF1587)/Protein of unknown function (DUF1585)/Protein of unknown function (DUF1595)/Planctomycete cytochrome C
MPRISLVFLVTLLAVAPKMGVATGPPSPDLERQFRETVRPFLQTYCVTCHGADKPKGDLDLSSYPSAAAAGKDFRKWELVTDQLRVAAMPPEKAKSHPTAVDRTAVLDWIKAVRKAEGLRTAGDPGPAAPRRLSHAEFDHTIRDLTGVDLRPAREFPVDPSNQAGFDNSAESQTTSPALVKKYLDAARSVADHLVLTPDGFAFAEFPVIADTDRDKYCVRKVIDFYKRQKTDYADYFQAAWRYRHRAVLGQPNATLDEVAKQAGISSRYLTTIWDLLQSPDTIGPVAAVKAAWNGLPIPDGKKSTDVRYDCERLRTVVVGIRKQLVPEVKNLTAPGMNNGSQPFLLWKNDRLAENRMRYVDGGLTIGIDGMRGTAAAKLLTPPSDEADVPAFEATFRRFCEVFPDTFVVTERARTYIDPEKEKASRNTGRLLNAGFHSMTGYYRDDGPLYTLVLDDAGRAELDRLWREFHFVTNDPVRQYTSFLWFERSDSSFMRDAEFDGYRAEDKDCTSETMIERLSKAYVAKVERRGGSTVAKQACLDFFRRVSADVRRVEADRVAAEPLHRAALLAFAEKAYRRPLTTTERDGVLTFYRTLREQDGLSHEDATRDSIVGILMSPHVGFRISPPATGHGVQPVGDYELASRLSYFLWASMPDAELLAKAAAGELSKPEVLKAQARRMLKDAKARGLATEFAGNWLDVRRFEEHNGVDRGRYPQFDSELRSAMFEEPMRFFLDVVREDRSVLDFLYADHTFVNHPLAKQYGMPIPDGTGWVRVDHAAEFGRGGLLPMAVFLTKNAPGLRTSPVKRGYWVVRQLLGERIPAPPAEVPELPADEAKLDLPLRDVLAKHRAHPACARCHDRFDAVGLAFEGFGPIGDRRSKDLAGKPVDTTAAFPGGQEGIGLAGLRAYIRDHRQNEFVDTLARKLLAYALGRSLYPGDDPLVETMTAALTKNGFRFGVLVDTIVTSPQFRARRGTDDAGKGPLP